jgi:radical SAM protein with 4Fe4S-binding SPASM domain
MKDLFHVQWHITNGCNLRCQHCYQEDFSREKDLDWAHLKKVSENLLSTLKEWGFSACIHLTGGEPFLKPELFTLLKHLDDHPEVEESGIITNGFFLGEEEIQTLSTFSKLKKIKISLDGATPETNDSIRGKGSFSKVIQSFYRIKDKTPFKIILMFTVMKRNFRELPDFIRFSQKLGVEGLIIERFIPWGRGRERRGEVLSKGDWNELVEKLCDLFSVKEKNLLLTFQAFQVVLGKEDPELLGAPCVLGKDGLCILPNGEVLPCRRFPIPIGNLLKDPLKKIWGESELLASLRRKENLKGKCRECEWRECRGCRSLALALTGDYLAEDPHCWHS